MQFFEIKEELSNELIRRGFRNNKNIARDSYQDHDSTASQDELATDDFSWAWEWEERNNRKRTKY